MFNRTAKRVFEKAFALQHMGKVRRAKQQYLRIIEKYPESEYATRSYAQLRTLDGHRSTTAASSAIASGASTNSLGDESTIDPHAIEGRDRKTSKANITDKVIADVFSAAKEGNVELVRKYLDEGIDVSVRSDDEFSLLHEAVRSGSVPLLKLLIEQGIDVNLKAAEGITPLMAAAAEGHIEELRYLIANGANIDAKTAEGQTALLFAASKGHQYCANELRDRGADVTVEDEYGQDATFLARELGGFEFYKDPILCQACDHEMSQSALYCGRCGRIRWSNLRFEIFGSLILFFFGGVIRASGKEGTQLIGTIFFVLAILALWNAVKVIFSSKTKWKW